MPRFDYGVFKIELRTNEHNHKDQKVHVHIYVGNEEQGSMFLDGVIKDGCTGLSSKVLRLIAKVVTANAKDFQTEWDRFQQSDY